jgi:hypothetical protein
VTETSTGTTIATAGYCADGPWAIDLFLMPVGSTEPAESDWRRDRPLRAAYETLRKLPDRPLIWRRASRSEAALFDNLTPRGRLVVRVNRLPRKAAESILKGAQR